MNKKFIGSIMSFALVIATTLCLCADSKSAQASTTYNVGYASAPSCTPLPGYSVTVNSYGQVSASTAYAYVEMQCPIPLDSSLTVNSISASFWNNGGSTGYGQFDLMNANTGGSVVGPSFSNSSEGVQTITLSSSITTGAATWLLVAFSGPVIFIGYSVNHN